MDKGLGKLIAELRNDSRQSLTALSHKLDVPISTLFSRMKRLDEESIILRYFSVLNLEKLGFIIQLQYLVKLKSEEGLLFLTGHPDVNTVSKLDDGYSIEAYFNSFRKYYQFKQELSRYIEFSTEILIIDEVKREDFLARESDFGK